MIYIYALVCPETGTPRYIGKTKHLDARLLGHIRKAKGGHTKSHCANWIRSLLSQGLAPIISVIAEIEDGGDWQLAEQEAIAAYRSNGFDLTNATSGGDGFHDLSPDAQAKRLAAWHRTMADPKRRAAFLEASAKARQTPESRLKRSRALMAIYANPIRKAERTRWMRTPEGKAKKAAVMTKRYADPELVAKHSAKMKEIWNTPDRRAEAAARSTKAWSNPEITKRRRESIAKAQATPEFKSKMSAAAREIGSRPEVKAIKSEKIKASWADPIVGAKRRAAISSSTTTAKMALRSQGAMVRP